MLELRFEHADSFKQVFLERRFEQAFRVAIRGGGARACYDHQPRTARGTRFPAVWVGMSASLAK